jgi:hypothetical protein
MVLAVASKLSPAKETERLLGISEFGVSEMFLVAGIAVLAVAQGGFYLRARSAAEILLALALLALVVSGRMRRRWEPVARVLAGIGALAVSGVVTGLVSGREGGLPAHLVMLGALAVALLVPATAGGAARRQLVDALSAIGVFLAASGWFGVVWHLTPIAHPDGGIWRAATTVTYANASAAILAMLALWGIARLTSWPSEAPGGHAGWPLRVSRVATMLLLTGLGATLSRAGIAAFVVGLVVLGALLGVRPVVRRAGPAVAGAVVATLALFPGLPASGPTRPAWACAGLATGLAVAAAPWRPVREYPFRRRANRSGRRAQMQTALAGLALVLVLAGLVIGLGRSSSVWSGRLSLASPDRTSVSKTALRMWDKHLLTGVGPGQTIFIWTTPEHQILFDRFAHDEYLQLAVEEGFVGLAGLALLIGGAAVTLIWGWNSVCRVRGGRTGPPGQASVNAALTAGAIAGLVAFGWHSAFDFLWHVPLVPLLAATAFGVAAPLPGSRKHHQTITTAP